MNEEKKLKGNARAITILKALIPSDIGIEDRGAGVRNPINHEFVGYLKRAIENDFEGIKAQALKIAHEDRRAIITERIAEEQSKINNAKSRIEALESWEPEL